MKTRIDLLGPCMKGSWQYRFVDVKGDIALYDVYFNGDKPITRFDTPVDVCIEDWDMRWETMNNIRRAFSEGVMSDEVLNKEAPF